MGGREPAVRPARAARPAGGPRTPASRANAARAAVLPRRRAGVRVPGGGGAGAGARGPDRRGPERPDGTGRSTRCSRPSWKAGAVQCGFCTPGLVVAAHDLLRHQPVPTDAEIREALAGNLCRCTGYEQDPRRRPPGRGPEGQPADEHRWSSRGATRRASAAGAGGVGRTPPARTGSSRSRGDSPSPPTCGPRA